MSSRNKKSYRHSSSTRRAGRGGVRGRGKGRTAKKQPRNSRRTSRPTLKQAFHAANQRAKKRANRRLGRKHGLSSVQAAIAGAAVDDDLPHLSFPQRLWRWLVAIALLPFCVIITRALFNVSDSGETTTFWMDLIRTRHFLFFSIGMILMAGWFFTGLMERLFLYFYVLGHELTHAIFVYACGGRVSDISVSADGGYIMTNKTNFIIALSPYFVPFWSIVFLLIAAPLDFFFDIPYQQDALYLLIGGSWAFHLLWTLWMIPRDQPDLQENGFFFSVVIIYLANVIVLSLLLLLAPGNLTWDHWANEFLDSWRYLKIFSRKVADLTL